MGKRLRAFVVLFLPGALALQQLAGAAVVCVVQEVGGGVWAEQACPLWLFASWDLGLETSWCPDERRYQGREYIV